MSRKCSIATAFLRSLKSFVPHSTDTQSLARATPYCARSTLDIVVQVRAWFVRGLCTCTVDNPLAKARGLSLRTGAQTMLYLSLFHLTLNCLKCQDTSMHDNKPKSYLFRWVSNCYLNIDNHPCFTYLQTIFAVFVWKLNNYLCSACSLMLCCFCVNENFFFFFFFFL